MDWGRRKMFWVLDRSKQRLLHMHRVCPYNKDFSTWWHQVGRRLVSTHLRKFMVWLDTAMGYGKRLQPTRWWLGDREQISDRIKELLKRKQA